MAKWDNDKIIFGVESTPATQPRSTTQARPQAQPQRIEVMGVADDDINKYLRFGSKSGSREAFDQLPQATRQPLIDAAREYYNRTGKQLQINSAMRSNEDQKRLYDETVRAGRPGIGPTGMPVAKPGQSAHGRGVAIDIQQGKNDPVAVGILNQYGFVQPIKNDPVHFEVRGGGAKPRGRIGPQPGGFMGAEEGPPPTLADVAGAAAKGAATVLGAPPVRGATFGLSVYPEAYLKQKSGETFADALERTRQEYQQARETYPAAVTGGEILGSMGSGIGLGLKLGKTAAGIMGPTLGSIAGPAAGSALGAGLQAYTESPETTLGQAAAQAAIAGGLSAGIGAGLTAFTGIAKLIGKGATTKTINTLLQRSQAGDVEADQQLEKMFGKAYKAFQDDLALRAPRIPTKEAPMQAKEFVRQQKEWQEATSALPKNIYEFAEQYAKDPSKFLTFRSPEKIAIAEQYSGRAPGTGSQLLQGVQANERQMALGAALQAAKLERENLMSSILPVGGGAGLGALYSVISGHETLADYAKSMATGAIGGATARLGGVGLYMSPGAQQAFTEGVKMAPGLTIPVGSQVGQQLREVSRETERGRQERAAPRKWDKDKIIFGQE